MRVRCISLLVAVVAAAGVEATVLVPMDLGELSRTARTIARGRVVEVEGRWADDRRRIETVVTLAVESSLKGTPHATLQFRVPGGQMGRYRSIVVGAPRFAEGQRVIVFLSAAAPDLPSVLGLSQGVYRIRSGSPSPVVSPPALIASPGPARRVVRGEGRFMPLAAFERQVRVLAEGTR
jgi:hypothetical protein